MKKVFMVTEQQMKTWQTKHKMSDTQMDELKIASQSLNDQNHMIVPIKKDISLNRAETSIIINKKTDESGYTLAFTQVGSTTITTDISVKVPPSSNVD